ncbi:hypothetical protein C0Z11_01850 [Acidipropionibacterium jensenii]|uniref:hypothetical protein n=1 Tax=Acidipropionibacterium jensenii TaxID=1749 RepID=UPI000BC314CE|nr:hypothetical protein [Acidipropionibacterium jensenii]AZZ41239.1 hypothetical protein C0Z11_01850 [Acidipropionibacterium jensenii]
MRVMPFRVLSKDAVQEHPPRLWLRLKSFEPGDDITGWDYLSEVTIEGELTFDPEHVRDESGLPEGERGLGRLLAVVRVDCPSTAERYVGLAPVDLTSGGSTVAVTIPAGAIADDVLVRYEVTLGGHDEPESPNRAAHLRGSRLYSSERDYKFHLEGDSSLFPVEAVSFRGGEFPKRSAWLVRFQADDLTVPFMGSVRLFVNRDHPASKQLIETGDGPSKAVLLRDVLLQMLVTISSRQEDEFLDDFPVGSTGAVLDELCASFLDTTLQLAVDGLRTNPGYVFSRLQEATGFLEKGN